MALPDDKRLMRSLASRVYRWNGGERVIESRHLESRSWESSSQPRTIRRYMCRACTRLQAAP
jgi:hypothetical protein